MFPISSVLLLSCFLHLAISFSPQDSGDAYVILYKDDNTRTSQLKLFLGEQFLVDIPLRNSDHSEDYDVINLVNVTQSFNSLRGVRNVTLGLEFVQDNLFKLTKVSPSFQVNGKSQNVVLASQNKCLTGLVVTDMSNATLPNHIIQKIILTPIDDDFSGRRVEISPFLKPRKKRISHKYL
uniref:Uncharacterized protein n=1 Tax=Cacopsylla melanoneura TaxID=428564 RepID=A0A8D9BJW4_9HEMI